MALLILYFESVTSAFCGVRGNSDLPQRGKGEVYSMGKERDGEIQQMQRRIWRINQHSQMQVQFYCAGKQVMICDDLYYKFGIKCLTFRMDYICRYLLPFEQQIYSY